MLWIADYCSFDEYELIGLFQTKFDAFIGCLNVHKEDMKYCNKHWKRNDPEAISPRFMRFVYIKKLGRYYIREIEILPYKWWKK